MRLNVKTLDRAGRDSVSALSLGYEADAMSGITKQEQVERLGRWRRDGWPAMMYHYHILAILIGYARAGRRTFTTELPGLGGY